mmetsp:Transcript_59500/g.129331  ORF Transcript_59500/g.129331 Transcript_59500/m.129331 type:complete len:325 (-) Transcript_59500:23-997(-)
MLHRVVFFLIVATVTCDQVTKYNVHWRIHDNDTMSVDIGMDWNLAPGDDVKRSGFKSVAGKGTHLESTSVVQDGTAVSHSTRSKHDWLFMDYKLNDVQPGETTNIQIRFQTSFASTLCSMDGKTILKAPWTNQFRRHVGTTTYTIESDRPLSDLELSAGSNKKEAAKHGQYLQLESEQLPERAACVQWRSTRASHSLPHCSHDCNGNRNLKQDVVNFFSVATFVVGCMVPFTAVHFYDAAKRWNRPKNSSFGVVVGSTIAAVTVGPVLLGIGVVAGVAAICWMALPASPTPPSTSRVASTTSSAGDSGCGGSSCGGGGCSGCGG